MFWTRIPLAVLLTILLVSTLTSAGLLAVWAATSPRHWFFRVALFVAPLSLLLLVPAYEPFLALLLQALIITTGIQLTRRWSRRAARGPVSVESATDAPQATLRSGFRFSLGTLLGIAPWLSIAVAIGVRMLNQEHLAWQGALVVGVAGGVATWLGWLAAQPRPGRRRWVVAVCACILALALGLVTDMGGLMQCLMWRSEDPAGLLIGQLSIATMSSNPISEPGSTALWMTIQVIIVLLSAALLALTAYVWGQATHVSAELRIPWRKTAFAVSVLLAVGIAAPAITCLCAMLTPDPIPAQRVPQPNGYDDFVAAGELAGRAETASGIADVSTATRDQLAAAMPLMLPALDRARIGLSRACVTNIDYHSFHSPSRIPFQDFRSLARLFWGKARLATMEGRHEDALASALNVMKFGYAVRIRGLELDVLVGVAIAAHGVPTLYEMRQQLSSNQCQSVIETLERIIDQREPLEAVQYRERVWSQHACGWWGRMVRWLFEIQGQSNAFDFEMHRCYKRELADMRMLIIELALQVYVAEHDRLPERLEQLESIMNPGHLLDPFSPANQRFRYQSQSSGSRVYSVGYNGVDDGGVFDRNDQSTFMQTGDLRLERYFE